MTPGRRPGLKAAAGASSTTSHGARTATATTDPVEHMAAIKAAVKQLGVEQVRRIAGLFE